MLVFSLLFLQEFNFQCASPLKYPGPIPDAELFSSTLLIRHGKRTPNDNWIKGSGVGTWICDSSDSLSPRMMVARDNGVTRRYYQTIHPKFVPFPPNCRNGDLLVEGMKQHDELGKFYRSILVDQLKFLPEIADTSLVEFRASKFERCVKSAESFINGLYPPLSPDEVFNITTGYGNHEFLFPDVSTCHELKEFWPKWKNTTDFKERAEAAKAKYAMLYQNFSINWDGENWLFLGDWFASYQCADQEIPSFISKEVQESALKDTAYLGSDFYGGQKGVAASPIWREIFRNYDSQFKGSPKRFHLYSAHDTTIIGILSSIGYKTEALPPFRSHCAIELWKKGGIYTIRIIFNGDPIPIDIANSETSMELTQFKQKMAPLLSFCQPELD